MRAGAALGSVTFIVVASLSAVVGLSAGGSSESAQQRDTGVVLGLVRDVGGGPIPGAAIVIERDAMVRKTFTDASGRYTIVDLPPGTYRIEMQLGGFRP